MTFRRGREELEQGGKAEVWWLSSPQAGSARLQEPLPLNRQFGPHRETTSPFSGHAACFLHELTSPAPGASLIMG